MVAFKAIAKFQTWGTFAGNQLPRLRALTADFRGENVGHAAIELQIPVTEENSVLISKYCKPPDGVEIPCRKKTIIGSDGSPQEIYVIRFSFIPDYELPFYLQKSYRDDCVYERHGSDTSVRDLMETSEVSVRRAPRRDIRIYPAASITAKGRLLDALDPRRGYIFNEKALENLNDELRTIKILETKLAEHNKNESLNLKKSKNKTIYLAAHRLNIKIQTHDNIVLPEDIGALQHTLAVKKEELVNKQAELKKNKSALRDKVLKSDQKKQIIANKRILQAIISLPNIDDLENLQSKLSTLNFDNLPIIFKEQAQSILDQLPMLAKEDDSITRTQIKSSITKKLDQLRAFAIGEYDRLSVAYKKINIEADQFFQSIDDYIYCGKPADGEVGVSIGKKEHELDLEAMLQQMRLIVDSKIPYDSDTHHCASTVMSILQAGKLRHPQQRISPAPLISTTTPQHVFDCAVEARDRMCSLQPISGAMQALDDFYLCAGHERKNMSVERPSYQSIDEAILSFAANIIFPDDPSNSKFYAFSKADIKAFKAVENKLISTELLRSLWNLIPGRALPLVEDGSLTVVVDKNLTMRQLVHGLTILAIVNAKERLQLHETYNPYYLLKNKITEQIARLKTRHDAKTISKVEKISSSLEAATKEIEADPELTNSEKASLLFMRLSSSLKINTGFGVREATSYTEVAAVAKKFGVVSRESVLPQIGNRYGFMAVKKADENTAPKSPPQSEL